MKSKILFSLGVLSALFVFSPNEGVAKVTGEASFKNVQSQYESIEPTKFNDFQLFELKDSYNLSDDILDVISTEDLVQSILAYPYIMDIMLFETYQEGFNSIRGTYNAIDELFSREDGAEQLKKVYESLANKTLRARSGQTYNFEMIFAEVMIGQSEVVEQLEETGLLNETVEEIRVNSSLKSSELYNTTKNAFIDVITDQVYTGEISPKMSRAIVYPTVKTPKGTKVTMIQGITPLTTAEKTQIDNDMARKYPWVTKLRQADSRYNCHSYAWYSNSPSNNWWMNDPSAYKKDGSYKSRTYGKVNDKVFYNLSNHTGVVTSIYPGPLPAGYPAVSMLDITGKWGKAGLYSGRGIYSPYNYTNLTYWYR